MINFVLPGIKLLNLFYQGGTLFEKSTLYYTLTGI